MTETTTAQTVPASAAELASARRWVIGTVCSFVIALASLIVGCTNEVISIIRQTPDSSLAVGMIVSNVAMIITAFSAVKFIFYYHDLTRR